MITKLSTEYKITRKLTDVETLSLGFYIDYERKQFHIFEEHEEGIMLKESIDYIDQCKAYCEMALEALEFIEKELSH